MNIYKAYDVIVVGGGHAGCEAALASARSHAQTALITMNKANVGSMPCNPSIGGIAKSHLVFELDALGGETAQNTDYTGLQFRTLNTRKGPAVQANRAQCDKKVYSRRMLAVLGKPPNLDIIEAKVTGIWMKNGVLQGVEILCGTKIQGKTVILAPGTCLNGRIFTGKKSIPSGGNSGDSADELSACLTKLGFRMARLKTGTPPRLHKDSLNYEKMEIQHGLQPPPFFSWSARQDSKMFHMEHSYNKLRPWQPGTNQIPCYLTHTTPITHQIIRDNLSNSALYGGAISGTGVRYCPSIEDKIVKFADKQSHHIFIEPEGRNSHLSYPNGISNSLPENVQEKLVHSIPGLEHARIISWAYAIEYDFCDPTQLFHTLETKLIENLYMAGQINGTTGYEEAAAQGFAAGINAALKIQQKSPFVLSRDQAYIGVLIDDLVTKGTDEPYRMFTSRAEHRLLLRQDNARFRMLPFAKEHGIVPDEYIKETETFASQIDKELNRLNKCIHSQQSQAEILRRPEIQYSDLMDKNNTLNPEVIRQVEIRTKYEGYIVREKHQAEKAKEIEKISIPKWIKYKEITGLRYEAQEKLNRVQPENIGQAARIPGVSPADIAILSIIIKRGQKKMI